MLLRGAHTSPVGTYSRDEPVDGIDALARISTGAANSGVTSGKRVRIRAVGVSRDPAVGRILEPLIALEVAVVERFPVRPIWPGMPGG